jgi:transcriptional regulator with XRE-family HTH domain
MAEQFEGIKPIGRIVAEFRAQKGLTQEKVAELIRDSNRSEVAYLEEGQRLPRPEQLEQICNLLGIPKDLWTAATHPDYLRAMEFQGLLGELIRKPLSLGPLDGAGSHLAVDAISQLLSTKMSNAQSFHQFNSVMTFYGERPVERAFFDRFLGEDAFFNLDSFHGKVRHFQAAALRLFGNFRKAWKALSACELLEAELAPLEPLDVSSLVERRPFSSIQTIPSERLDDLGYIAAERVKKEHKDRKELAEKLLHVANALKSGGVPALEKMHKRTLNRIRTLLRQFNSTLELEPNLFGTIDHLQVESEAKRIAPQEKDLAQIENTQNIGIRNLAAYLTEPFIDVYVATSMREHADFISVNNFVEVLFRHPSIAKLHLRYFNPTQSWIEDRVAKGTVEALMLKRAKLTVYMAQKSDTFGKDSEASVALGQGKPVIVYVPRLFDHETAVDSEALFHLDDAKLLQTFQRAGLEDEEGIDRKERVTRILRNQLEPLPAIDVARIIEKHWADFDLYGEISKMPEELRVPARKYLDGVALRRPGDALPLPESTVSLALLRRLVDVAVFFEGRTRTFRDVHPLALQVIVRSGVLNGIVVVRAVETCAEVMYRLITNTIEADVVVDKDNYRLCERITGSTLRVVSRYPLLNYAFWTQYFRED